MAVLQLLSKHGHSELSVQRSTGRFLCPVFCLRVWRTPKDYKPPVLPVLNGHVKSGGWHVGLGVTCQISSPFLSQRNQGAFDGSRSSIARTSRPRIFHQKSHLTLVPASSPATLLICLFRLPLHPNHPPLNQLPILRLQLPRLLPQHVQLHRQPHHLILHFSNQLFLFPQLVLAVFEPPF